ncbi:threonine ammonia-lyase IlvA [Candidatus Daviesbacteria bacterium]|nr:threonine ammonia-lyase IlvA [Candidatus Daviesbacteria bacterium]
MNKINTVTIDTIDQAAKNLEGVVKKTSLEFSKRLSQEFSAKVYIKREDQQEVRSYKIRGAYNLMSSLTKRGSAAAKAMVDKEKRVVCASAGNHAQGVAYSANALKVKATIFMPKTTPLQKVHRVEHFGDGWIEIKLIGHTFDESNTEAHKYCEKIQGIFIPPFDDYTVISGQGTVGKEIFDELGEKIDVVFCPIGGGGLVSGVGTYLKTKIPSVKLIGVEPENTDSMAQAVKQGKVVTLENIETFVDGAAVKTVGQKTFEIASKLIDDSTTVSVGKVCTTMIELYQNEGIISEPAGALSIAALNDYTAQLQGKTVVCILSGGNNDILRYPEIMEKSLVYLGLKHYFLIEFAQKPGQLKEFVNKALGPTDDIVRFEYIKKTEKEKGPALIGIELDKRGDLEPLLKRMDEIGLSYTRITSSDLLYSYLI